MSPSIGDQRIILMRTELIRATAAAKIKQEKKRKGEILFFSLSPLLLCDLESE
jgi:hypothetical protein